MNYILCIRYISALLFILFFFVHSAVVAQPTAIDETTTSVVKKNSEGTEFWLVFARNYQDERRDSPRGRGELLDLELFITAQNDAKVSIEIDGIGYRKEVRVPGATVVNVQIDPSAHATGEEVIQRLGVHVVSDKPISVYGLNRRYQTTDTYQGLPTSVLGTEYRAIGYSYSGGMMSQFTIIATEDSTEVTITPRTRTAKLRPANVPFSVKLKRGDVYNVSAFNESSSGSTCDLTGSLIQSNKRISVFSGHQCAYVPAGLIGCNHLVEQLPPIAAWGKHYYVGMLERRSRSTIRVVASQPQTKVFENSQLAATLNAGEFYENSNVRQNLQVTADKPILLAQYSQGYQNGDDVGDPMMLLISPTQQFLNRYRFATPINGEWKHYVNVVVPTNAISSLRLDNRRVDSTLFLRLALSRYSVAQLQIPFGTHTVQADSPFGLTSYGFGYGGQAYDAYGNLGGQSFFEIVEEPDTLPPTAESRMVGERINVIFRDDRIADKGLKSVKALFAVNLQAAIPKIEEGVPQVNFLVKPIDPSGGGRMVIEAKDAAGNRSIYTVCYSYDAMKEEYGLSLCPGDNPDCDTKPGWIIGIAGGMQQNFHTADFASTAGMTSKGIFSGSAKSGWIAAATVGRRFFSDLALSGRLYVENRPGIVSAPDAVFGTVRDGNTGQMLPFQEAQNAELSGTSAALSIVGEWYLDRSLYGLFGVRTSFAFSSAAKRTSSILQPLDFVYSENGSSELPLPDANLAALRSIVFSAVVGCGFSYPLTLRYSINAELQYNHGLQSILSDGEWKIHQLSLLLGVRYRL